MWLLFVVVVGAGNVPPSITTQEFVSERACLEAHDQLISLSGNSFRNPVRAFCVHDSDEP